MIYTKKSRRLRFNQRISLIKRELTLAKSCLQGKVNWHLNMCIEVDTKSKQNLHSNWILEAHCSCRCYFKSITQVMYQSCDFLPRALVQLLSHRQPQQPDKQVWKLSPQPLLKSVQRLRTLKAPPSSLTLPGWVAALLYRHQAFDTLCNFPLGSRVHGIKPWRYLQVTCWVTSLHIRKHTGSCHSYSQAFPEGWKSLFYRRSPVKITVQVSPSCSDHFKLSLDSAKLAKGSPWESYAWFI